MKKSNLLLLLSLIMVSCKALRTISKEQKTTSIDLLIETRQEHLGFQSKSVIFEVMNNSNNSIYIPIPSINLTDKFESPEFFSLTHDLSDCDCFIYSQSRNVKGINDFIKIEPKEVKSFERNFSSYNYDCYCESAKSDTINVSLNYKPDPLFFEEENLKTYYSKGALTEILKIRDQILLDTIIVNKKIVIVK